ncbi:hypothetical protein [Armatimonas rosea]|uniref:Uncharacterized protein n=1 Tax=Armatimonas rosea TaxID=685828 RepID=A0A7W9SUJ3_ARMRO|nr:hypothetical protein [Armatimonas rosea]MBB6052645.1 hypothetical protein [Armatimonas rosea]
MILQRRNLLKLALALPLAGCGGGWQPGFGPIKGGGSGGDNSVPTRSVAGRVVFPTGTPVTLSALKVETALGAVAIDGNGSCQIPTSQTATSPTLAWVRNNTAVLYLGFVDDGDATIDATSTAVALLYLSLGGFQAEEVSKSLLLSGLRKHAATATLAQVVAARVTAVPTALAEGDAALGAALKTAHNALVAELSATGRATATPAPSRSRATTTASLLLEPAIAQSNLRVDQATAPQTFIATNQARRYCQVMTYEINRENKSGQRTNPSKARLVSSVWLPSTPALGFKDTATGFFSRKTAFTPVATDPITLSMNDGDAKTFFEVVVLGSSSLVGDPPVYSEPRYASEVGVWREIRADLNLSSWVADVLLGLLLELWGLRDFVAQKGAIREAVQKFRKDYATIETRLFIAADAGDLSGALTEVLRLLATNPAFVEYMVSLSITLSPNLKSYLFADTVKNSTALLAKSLMTVLNVAGLVLGAGDLGAVIVDLASSEPVERWSATLVTSDVTLSPALATIAPGDSLALSARLPNALGANIVYKWSLVGSDLATLTDVKEGKSGLSFETSGSDISLATTPSTKGTLTVTVEAVELSSGGNRTSRGQALSTVTVNDDVPFGSVRVVFDGKTRILPKYSTQRLGSTTGLALGALYQAVSTAYGGKVALKLTLQFATKTLVVGSTATVTSDYDLTYELPAGSDSLYFAPSAPGTLTVTEVGPGYFGYTLSVNLKGLRGVPTTGPATFKGWVTDY